MSVKVSSKYQVVIPDRVRQALGLRPGVEVDVIAKGGIAYIVPVKSVEDVRKRIRNKLTAEDMTALREKKDRKI
jgi:AbrB family looped-hinge helix DNA binding protein